jgi:hypothetical protein
MRDAVDSEASVRDALVQGAPPSPLRGSVWHEACDHGLRPAGSTRGNSPVPRSGRKFGRLHTSDARLWLL